MRAGLIPSRALQERRILHERATIQKDSEEGVEDLSNCFACFFNCRSLFHLVIFMHLPFGLSRHKKKTLISISVCRLFSYFIFRLTFCMYATLPVQGCVLLQPLCPSCLVHRSPLDPLGVLQPKLKKLCMTQLKMMISIVNKLQLMKKSPSYILVLVFIVLLF